jgi:prephenate dehydratase
MLTIAYLGPPGTYSELAALAYTQQLNQQSQSSALKAFPSIAQAIQSTARGETDLCVVPVENSIGGSVTTTLDTLWELDQLQIQKTLILPIHHVLLSFATKLQDIDTVYSHYQALAQCQKWLENALPQARLIPTNSTTEALQYLEEQSSIAVIASLWAAKLYQLPIIARSINDHDDNCTRFWVLSCQPSQQGRYTSLAFSLPTNTPGALLKPLQLFATQNINMSRIESRPTKRSLGDYLFFIDIEASLENPHSKAAIQLLENCTETLKIFGSYDLLELNEISVTSGNPIANGNLLSRDHQAL